MSTLPLTPLPTPLCVDDQGVVRVGGTRVTLDTLVCSYRDGNTAEEIVQQFPTLGLAETHAVIAYYLTHQDDVDSYLRLREAQAAETRREVAETSDQRGVRDRLLSRQAGRRTGA